MSKAFDLDPVMERVADLAFSEHYWKYSDAVDLNVKNAAQMAFRAGIAFAMADAHEKVNKRLEALEAMYTRLEVCPGCEGPRFKDAYCPNNDCTFDL